MSREFTNSDNASANKINLAENGRTRHSRRKESIMTNINNIFATASSNTNSENSRSLAGTARLTSIANNLAGEFMAKLSELDENSVVAAMHDNNLLDELIRSTITIDVTDEDREFFAELGDKTADGMLKSQQSKRSRCKSKDMTQDNFRSMVSAAIAELIIRDVYGKTKNAAVSGGRRADVGYTDDELEQLANDQEALKRAIRNVQSKKSIMKSKAGFDETSEGWLQLLEVEAQLKERRVATTRTKTVKVDETKAAVAQLLTDVDINKMKAADAKELLSKILGLTAGNVNESSADESSEDDAE